MTDVREETDALLADHPHLESALEELLQIDRRKETWTFDDIPMDSGGFGELVARGIVEQHDDGYTLADPSDLAAALHGEGAPDRQPFPGRAAGVDIRALSRVLQQRLPSRTSAVVLGVTLTLLAAFRLFSLQSVFRNGAVVLSGNDPYFYRYWVDQLASAPPEPLLPAISQLPAGVATGEPLLVVTLWFAAEAFGGTPTAVGQVLAWYPVVFGVLTGLVVYHLAQKAMGDPRVSIAAVALYAITPVAAYRTSLGFADHHAFDYLWLALTVSSLTVLAARSNRPSGRLGRWGPMVVLAMAVSGQTLAWDNSPVLLAPLAIVGVGMTGMAARAGRPPGRRVLPLLGGLWAAVAVVAIAHWGLNWHSWQVAATPALLASGLTLFAIVAHLGHRTGLSAHTVLAGAAVAVSGAAVAVTTAVPDFSARLLSRLGVLLSDRGIAEMTGLFSEQLGTVIGPVFLFGFVLFLGLPYLGWLTWRAGMEDRPVWLPLTAYGWYFFALSMVQIRFAGQLAPILAVTAGLGFVHLAAAIDLTVSPWPLRNAGDDIVDLTWPTPRTLVTLGLLFLFVGSMSFVQTPVKTSQLTTDATAYETATWIESDAREQGLAYPANYVLSSWDRNRMFNYFVNGHSRSYGFARSNYQAFLAGTDPGAWHERLTGRVGYIVIDIERPTTDLGHGTMAARLTTLGTDLERYRAVYRSSDGRFLVYTLVPGATIVATVPSNASRTLSTTVRITGAAFAYNRTATAGPDGRLAITVPYPGRYRFAGRTVTVTAADIRNGSTITVPRT